MSSDSNSTVIYLSKLFLLAIAYSVAAKLSLLLRIQTDLVPPLWLGSGIALAAILLGGYRYLPGVFLGAVVAYFWALLPHATNIAPDTVLDIAVMLAVIASVQAAASAFIIKRVVILPTSLSHGRDIGMLMLFSGPIGSLIMAIIGPLALLLGGLISQDAYLANSITFWLADTLAAIVLVPLLLIIATHTSTTRKMSAVAPTLIVSATVIAAFIQIRKIEQHSIAQAFDNLVVIQEDKISIEISQCEEVLRSICWLYSASQYVDRNEFSLFTRDTINRHNSIQALKWIPRVHHTEKEAYEISAHNDGYLHFRIVEKIGNKTVQVAPRDNYFPVYYVEPLRGNESALGFDLASDGSYVSAMADARDSGQLIATAPINLEQVKGNQKSILMLHAIYDNGKPIDTISERQNHLHGFALGIFRMDDLISSAISPGATALFNLHIYDNYLRGSDALLYGREEIGPHFSQLKILETAGRQWTLVFTPTSTFLQQNRRWRALAALTAGVILTALFQTFMALTTARTEVFRQWVDERTAQLFESKRALAAILDATPSGVITVDSVGTIVSANSAITDIFGYTRHELLGKNIETLVPKDHRSTHEKQIVHYVNSGQKRSGMAPGRRVIGMKKSGDLIPLEVGLNRTVMPNGTVKVIASVTDISERHKQEKLQQQLMDKLVASNAELERFAFVASHDLQEPLRMVQNFTRLLEKRYSDQLDDVARSYITFACSSATRMQALVNDLLEYARVRDSAENNTTVNVEETLQYVIENLSDRLDESGATVTHDPLPSVNGNPVRIARVMQNLIVNALKYQEKGNIPTVHVGVKDTADGWLFSITDNGIGIKKEYCTQIFEPFKRLHSMDQYSGTGMGLAICAKIVDTMGGKIWVESEFGVGSTFYVNLPKKVIDHEESIEVNNEET